MSNIRRITYGAIVLIFSLFLFACNGTEREHAGQADAFTMEDIQDDPDAFLGEITLTGTVSNVNPQGFALVNEAGDFHIIVEYHGTLDLPEIGNLVTVAGLLSFVESCCDEFFTISATQYEIHEG
ncbi:MAG: hypothetical protein FWE25_11025 [Lachnospiraceae bacterium]|nr:hypothetical protein [Lachnospiraceae bacterium]